MKNKSNAVATAIILIMLMLLFAIACNKLYSQDGISASILQDAKLGLGMDKLHKNDTPTLDLIINVNLDGKQFEWYYFSIQMLYERANLYDGYFSRYGVNTLWNFNQLIVRKLKIGAGIGLHMIERHNTGGLGSYSATIDVSYPITKNLSIISKNEWLRRPDLITPKLCYNLSFGLNYKI